MRYILILFMLVGVANAQFAPTSSKTKFINGISLGSKDTSAFSANDSMVVTMARDSVLYYKYKGYWRTIGGSTAAYKLISDTLFNNGYTTRARLKQAIDSLAASTVSGVSSFNSRTGAVVPLVGDYSSFYKGVADSFFVDGFTTRGRTKQGLDSLGALKLNVSDTASMLARGWLANRSLDTATALQARIQTKQPLLTNPITGTGTSGQVAYWNGTSTQTGSSNLFWDNTNRRLGIGTSSPTQNFYISNSSAVAQFKATSATGQAVMSTTNSGETAANDFATYGASASGTLYGLSRANMSTFTAYGTNLTSLTVGTSSNVPLVFGTFETERARFVGAGRLLINTTTDNGVDNVQVNGSLIATTLKATNPLGIAYGGTGSSTQNFVDLSSTQSGIGGAKTFTSSVTSGGATENLFIANGTSFSGLRLSKSGTSKWAIFNNNAGTDFFDIYNYAKASSALTINPSTNLVNVTGNTTIGGTLGVTGAQTNSSSIAATRVTMNNSTQTQGEFWGWSNIQGASINTGEIRLGGTEALQGRILYSSAGNTALYIENTFNDANAEIRFRTRVAGTALTPLILTSNTASITGTLGVTGAITASSSVTATSFFESSDIRLKNIIKRDGDVAYFSWKSDSTNRLHVGYIAQEVQLKNPSSVNTDEKGMLSVNYIEILVQKVRDLEKRIAQLENK